jgi:ABC-type transporter Mla subunit MlaD
MGTGNSATNAATQANADQQAQINGTIAQINSAFNSPSRQAQYAQYGTNLGNYLTGLVNDQEHQNARNLKFAEARSGLTGGSASVDANSQLQKDYTQGLLQASRAAQTGQAQLEQADIGTKNSLIAQAEQGAYLGSIPQAVASATQANLGAAQNFANANSLGNLFQGTSSIYNNEQTAAATRKAQTSPIGSLYGGGSTGNSVWG